MKFNHAGTLAFNKIAFLVEDAIVWQVHLVVNSANAAVFDKCGRIHKSGVCTAWVTQHHGDTFQRLDHTIQPDVYIVKKPVPEQQVLGWIPADTELRKYDKICSVAVSRLLDLGEPEASLEAPSGRSALYHYLLTLRSTVERVAAGPFAREAIAEVRNQQFIELCAELGDERTEKMYADVIQPEEVEHNRAGRTLLARYATTPELQHAAQVAMRSSLAIADELSTLAEATTGLSPIPVS